jgi:tetratricopeptide (TPR) repeat protein
MGVQMIPGLAVLLLAFAAPGARQPASARVPAPTFEQISQAAQQARDQNRDEDAIRLFQQGLKLKPDWDEGLWYLGTLSYEKERFREARDLLRHFLAQNPQHGPGWALLGLSEYKTREYGRALPHLQRARALGLEDRKELANAVFYHEAVLLTRSEQYHDSLLLLYQMRGAGQAQEALEEPAGLAVLGYPLLPEEVPAQRRALVRMAGAGNFARLDQRRADAEKLLREMVDEYPREPGVHYQYGLLLLDDRPAEGIAEMEKELTITPSYVPARLRLAEYYLAQSEPAKARPYVDEVIKMEPGNATAHLLLGEALGKTGDDAGSIRELELARELAPKRGKVLWALLRAYKAAGRQSDADRIRAEIENLSEAESAR